MENNLAQYVKDLRKCNCLSQQDLADKAGLSLRTVQRIEKAETKPMGESLKRISDVFGLEPDEFNSRTSTGKLKKTVEVRSMYLHIFDNKLIISNAKEINISNTIGDYEKSVSNMFKSITVFLIFIPIFGVLSALSYSTRPELSFYAGAMGSFFMIIAIYVMQFTSGSPLIYRSLIKSVSIQRAILGNAIVIKYYNRGRLKMRTIPIKKSEVEVAKEALLNEKVADSATINSGKKAVAFGLMPVAATFLVIFTPKFLFKDTSLQLSGTMWGSSFIIASIGIFFIFFMIKKIAEARKWRKMKRN